MGRLIPAAVAMLGLMLASVAVAQEKPSPELPVLLKADEIRYDEKLGLVVAMGNVEISQGERILRADTMTYNQREDKVTASGNVALLEPTGEVVFADFVELSDEMKNGVIRNLRVRLTDNSRLAATGARRTGGVRTEMRKAVFSPCQNCKEKPSGPPLWQIRAAKVVHDQERHEIEYFDAFLEFFEVPVAYTPYFSHPDPTVKRRSGFLAPSFGSSGNIGTILEIPYYYVIGPDKDATISPIIATDQDLPVLSGEYRQRLTTGEFTFQGSITQADREDPVGRVESDKIRGHIKGAGRFVINDAWRWGFDLQRTTDDTYLQLYNFSNEDILTSRGFIEGFRGRNYAAANVFDFEDLRASRTGEPSPLILPMLEYDLHSEPGRRGAFWTLNANLLSLSRTQGTDSRRVSFRGGWHLPHTGSNGQVYELAATVEGDVYVVNDFVDPNTPAGPVEEGVFGRIFPQLRLQWRYPFIRSGGGNSQIIEPIAGLVVGPSGVNPDDIPNEDSQALEFDDTNLFSPNRFPGRDLIDDGQRIDYGLRLSAFSEEGHSLIGFIGQSFRFQENGDFEPTSGLRDELSDVVGRVDLAMKENLDLLYRFRFDKDDFSIRRNELAFTGGVPELRLHANYLLINQRPTPGGFGDREELTLSASSRLTRNVSISASSVRDLQEDAQRSVSLGLTYQDDCQCALLNFTFARNFTRNREIEPADTIFVRLVLKHLGEVQAAQSVGEASGE